MPLFGPVGDDWPPRCQVNMQMSPRGAPIVLERVVLLSGGLLSLFTIFKTSAVLPIELNCCFF